MVGPLANHWVKWLELCYLIGLLGVVVQWTIIQNILKLISCYLGDSQWPKLWRGKCSHAPIFSSQPRPVPVSNFSQWVRHELLGQQGLGGPPQLRSASSWTSWLPYDAVRGFDRMPSTSRCWNSDSGSASIAWLFWRFERNFLQSKLHILQLYTCTKTLTVAQPLLRNFYGG